MKEIILASSSPYRKELLERLGINFKCISPNVNEDKFKKIINDPIELATKLAFEKANEIAKQNPHAIVIGSDQLVNYQNDILGKPGNKKSALKQILRMQGDTHELVTAVCIISDTKQHPILNITKLTMRNLSDQKISEYLDYDSPYDCAGSYKLESRGISLFSKIETSDHTAIIGLPLLEVGNVLNLIDLK